MPYNAENSGDVGSMKEKLEKTYSSVSDTAARQAIHIFNSVMDSSSDEGRAWAGVYSQMNDRLSKKASSTRVASRFLVAASEIDLAELSRDRQGLVKSTGLKPQMAWHGIHGYIVDFKPSIGGLRMSSDTMKKIVNNPLCRWVQFGDRGTFSIGM